MWVIGLGRGGGDVEDPCQAFPAPLGFGSLMASWRYPEDLLAAPRPPFICTKANCNATIASCRSEAK